MNLAQITDIVRDHSPLKLPESGLTRSAVLVLLRSGPRGEQDSPEVFFTRRSADLPSHAGQVSFPGGRIDSADETPEQTALRETQEELGIASDVVKVVGRLDDYATITGYHVVPVVGIVSASVRFEPNPTEVAKAFTVPLEELCDVDRWQEQTFRFKGSEIRGWHFPFEGEDIWGATAFMLRGFIEILTSEVS